MLLTDDFIVFTLLVYVQNVDNFFSTQSFYKRGNIPLNQIQIQIQYPKIKTINLPQKR